MPSPDRTQLSSLLTGSLHVSLLLSAQLLLSPAMVAVVPTVAPTVAPV